MTDQLEKFEVHIHEALLIEIVQEFLLGAEKEREREEAGDLGFRLPGWNLSSLGSDE